MTAFRPNSVTGVFCLAYVGFLENSEPTLKNQISHRNLKFWNVLTISKAYKFQCTIQSGDNQCHSFLMRPSLSS